MRRILLPLLTAGLLALLAGRWRMAALEPVTLPAEPWNAESRFVQTRTGRVHVLDLGEGPVLLLLHGTARSLADWQEGTAEGLARQHRVVAFDFYGNGLSDRAHGLSYGSVLWAQQGIDVMDALGIEHASVIGHSIGGVVASLMGADFPDRVSHVITIGTGMAMDPAQIPIILPIIGEWSLGTRSVFGTTHSATHRSRIESGFRIAGTRAALLVYLRRQYTIDGFRLLDGVYEEIRAPVLHVSGSQDSLISTETAERLSHRTGGKFVRIDGVGHDVHIQSPERLVREIEIFLDETNSAQPASFPASG
ncbi:MAG: alpha/beta hydrolase [bacterium]|nr:alpha/beta hydrolase [bacterium]